MFPLPKPTLLLASLLSFPVSAAFGHGIVTVELQDYAAVPQSGALANSTDNSIYVARVNFLREEPGGGLNRFFVCDLNGKLYILDKTTKQFATYLDFQRNTTEVATATGLFPAFTRNNGYANGLVTFQFDPEYRNSGSPHFGKFYTVHIEIDTNNGDSRRLPNASAHPGFTNASSYAPTDVHEAPGIDNSSTRHAVLIEWQDTQPANATFEGTARELLRIEFNGRIHPVGDLLFNPLAIDSSHPDWRRLYIAVGDGGAGEQNNATLHATPQRLDVLQGKILRIIPDDPDGAGPLRYTVPLDNPFGASTSGNTRGEIWAYGFRNPHRLTWDPVSNLLLTTDIGFHSWEEINIVRRGANYGWGEREGTFVLHLPSGIADRPLPANDASNNYVYPVAQYPHSPALGYGDAIAGGFVYRGARVPQLQGKFVFGDITTGQLFYTDLAELIAADDGNPATLASFHRIDVFWNNPRNPAGLERFDRMYEIVADEYRARGGTAASLPGSATVSNLTGGGRADIRLAVDAAGELYVLSKSDGMIRAIVGDPLASMSAAPTIHRHPDPQTVAVGGTAVFSVEASADAAAYQWRRNNTPIPGATGSTFVLSDATASASGDYTVEVRRGPAWNVSRAAPLTVTPAANPGRVTNFSIRSLAGSGAQTLIVGLAVDRVSGSSDNQTLLVRGVGPGLIPFSVTGVLADPKLEFFRGGTRLLENDNWGGDPAIAATAAQVAAFSLPADSRDAALLRTGLAPGAYTAQITSATAGGTGVALAEIWDATPSGLVTSQLVNVSARTQVAAGENVLIAGFVIGGTTARTVLVRAAGPVLSTFGVTGTLSDPKLTLYRGSSPIASSDNWQTSFELVDVFSSTGAFPFVARSNDAALLLTLPPGNYTAEVSGAGTATSGVALVEVYVLP